mmetsp:Transcript_14702/g.29498  ORF Transcript_14702/g.29498 Transcript_14702/m.29498 type:complete len:207 (-) Transcript_14702:420-1040(-)
MKVSICWTSRVSCSMSRSCGTRRLYLTAASRDSRTSKLLSSGSRNTIPCSLPNALLPRVESISFSTLGPRKRGSRRSWLAVSTSKMRCTFCRFASSFTTSHTPAADEKLSASSASWVNTTVASSLTVDLPSAPTYWLRSSIRMAATSSLTLLTSAPNAWTRSSRSTRSSCTSAMRSVVRSSVPCTSRTILFSMCSITFWSFSRLKS